MGIGKEAKGGNLPATSPSSESSDSDSEVNEASSSEAEWSLPEVDSVVVEGWYSCLRGDEDRRRVLYPGRLGESLGTDGVLPGDEMGDLCMGGGGGLSSTCFSGSILVASCGRL